MPPSFALHYMPIAANCLHPSKTENAIHIHCNDAGNLSGKYEEVYSTNYSRSFVDWNLPLFGANSIAGRSVVISTASSDR